MSRKVLILGVSRVVLDRLGRPITIWRGMDARVHRGWRNYLRRRALGKVA